MEDRPTPGYSVMVAYLSSTTVTDQDKLESGDLLISHCGNLAM
jgi:hypothetical protein